ncbi:MAG TPA: hypothetical protein VIV07_09815 [Sphingomicrobium sp.]
MMEKSAGAALLVIGVVALFAAIVGGGLKVRDIEVGSVPSRLRQGLLALFGVAIAITGLALIWDDEEPTQSPDVANTAEVVATNATDTAADANGVDTNAPETHEADANVPADENSAQ